MRDESLLSRKPGYTCPDGGVFSENVQSTIRVRIGYKKSPLWVGLFLYPSFSITHPFLISLPKSYYIIVKFARVGTIPQLSTIELKYKM